MSSLPHRVNQASRYVLDLLDAGRQILAARFAPMSGRATSRATSDDLSPGLVGSAHLVDHPRIVLDGVFFQLQDTGISRMWRSVMTEWSRTGFAEHVVVLERGGKAPTLPGFTYRAAPPFRYHDSAAQRPALQSICDAEQADLFASTYYTIPSSTPSLLCVYDMIPEALGFDLSDRQWREKHRAIEYASSFVAISANTADDLHRFFPDTAEKPLTIAPCAADSRFAPRPAEQITELRRQLDLPTEYVVFVGGRSVAYKNAAGVLRSLAAIPAETRPALLFVGGSAELEPELAALADGIDVRVAHLDDEQLATAYCGALCYAHASRYEGFGIPILEAMACGCPVVAFDNSSVAEVAGEAALLVTDGDLGEFAAAIGKLGDAETRAECQARGLEQAARFSWSACARTIEDALRSAAEASVRPH